MGADPNTSVVNSYLQMWDAQNVFVVGASNFPQNAGFNPTGTVGGLAYRAADGILKYHQKGGSPRMSEPIAADGDPFPADAPELDSRERFPEAARGRPRALQGRGCPVRRRQGGRRSIYELEELRADPGGARARCTRSASRRRGST